MSESELSPGPPPSAAGAGIPPAPGAACATGSEGCPPKPSEWRLVEVVEVIDSAGTRKPVETRRQYINLDDQVDTRRPHPDYGRKIRLQARIEWVSGDKSRSLAGHNLYWYSITSGGNKTGLTGKEKEAFTGWVGAKRIGAATPTQSDGWTDIVEFVTSQYGGDVFSLFVTDKADYSGGLPAGCYKVWRKFWYQVTEMKDNRGGVFAFPDAVKQKFEARYRDVYIEFSETLPRNQVDYVWNMPKKKRKESEARDQNHFSDYLRPFKAQIVAICHAEEHRKLTWVEPKGTVTAAQKWVSPAKYYLWWEGTGAKPWLESAQYQTTAHGAWKTIDNSLISQVQDASQPGLYHIAVDFSSQQSPVQPSKSAPVKIAFIIYTNPGSVLGWGGGSSHVFLCTGFINRSYLSKARIPIQQGTAIHEIGHALGLVNMPPVEPGTDGWEDKHPGRENHCEREHCVMWYDGDENTPLTFHLKGGVGCHYRLRRQDYSRAAMEKWEN